MILDVYRTLVDPSIGNQFDLDSVPHHEIEIKFGKKFPKIIGFSSKSVSSGIWTRDLPHPKRKSYP